MGYLRRFLVVVAVLVIGVSINIKAEVIDNCEDVSNWKKNYCKNADYSFSTLDEQKHQGDKSLKVEYTYSGSDGYFMIEKTDKISEQPNKVSFWVYGDNSKKRVCIRIVDKTEEKFYYEGPIINWNGWKLVSQDILIPCKWPNAHWGGNNNNIIDLPCTLLLQISNTKQAQAGKGTVYFDEITITTGEKTESATTKPPQGEKITGTPYSTDFEKDGSAADWESFYGKLDLNYNVSTEQSHSGKQSLKLNYPGEKGQKWVKLARQVDYPVEKIKLWLYANNNPGVSIQLRLQDKTGEMFAWPEAIKSLNWDGWRLIAQPASAPVKWPNAHWGGNNDNKIDLPATFILIIYLGENTGGTFYIDDLELAGKGGVTKLLKPPAKIKEESYIAEVLLDGFETKKSNWAPGLTSGVTGFLNPSEKEAHTGKQSGEINYTSSGGYFVLQPGEKLPGEIQKLSFWIDGNNNPSTKIYLRLIDSSGEIFAWQMIEKLDWKGWKQLVKEIKAPVSWPNVHWGGNNDNKIDWPVSLGLQIGSGKGKGIFYIDDMLVETKLPVSQILAMKIGSDKQSNIFYDTENVILSLILNNLTKTDQLIHLKCDIEDYFGNKVFTKEEDFVLEATKTSFQKSIPINCAGKKGYFTAHFTLSKRGKTIDDAIVPFGIIPRRKEKITDYAKSPFGICDDVSNIELLKDLGIYWVRYGTYWQYNEPQKGVYNFTIADNASNASSDLAIVYLAAECANWASSGPEGSNKRAYLPKDPRDYAEFHKVLANRYKNKGLKYWEIWNEIDTLFWQDKTPKKYTDLLKATYIALKQEDTDCKVVVSGGCHPDLEYLKGVYENGGGDYFDVANFHCYTQMPEDGRLEGWIKDVKSVANKYGGGKPIWITERGYDTSPLSHRPKISQKQAAQYLVRSYLLSIKEGIDKIFWFNWRCYHTEDWGILNVDGSLKPSFITYKTMTDNLLGADFAGDLQLKENKYGYVFAAKNNKPIVVLWSYGEEATEKIDLDSQKITITDIMGNESSLTSDNSVFTLRLSPDPIFIYGAGKKILLKALKNDITLKFDEMKTYLKDDVSSNLLSEIDSLKNAAITEESIKAINQLYQFRISVLDGSGKIKKEISYVICDYIKIITNRLTQIAALDDKKVSTKSLATELQLMEKDVKEAEAIYRKKLKKGGELKRTKIVLEETTDLYNQAKEAEKKGQFYPAYLLASQARLLKKEVIELTNSEKIRYFANWASLEVPFSVVAGSSNDIKVSMRNEGTGIWTGQLKLSAPENWEVTPSNIQYTIGMQGSGNYTFNLKIPDTSEGNYSLKLEIWEKGELSWYDTASIAVLSPVNVTIKPIDKELKAGETIELIVESLLSQPASGKIIVSGPAGWSIKPDSILYSALKKGADKHFQFTVEKMQVAPFNNYKLNVLLTFHGKEVNKTIPLDIPLCKKSVSKISIDGNLNDWEQAYPLYLYQRAQVVSGADVWQGKDDLSAIGYTMWDNENFYFAIKVTDSSIRPNDNAGNMIWGGDTAIELFIDTDLSDKGKKEYSKDDYQLLLACGNEKAKYKNARFYVMPKGKNFQKVEVASKILNDGYIIEVCIPLFNFPALKPQIGQWIGFDIAVDDADGFDFELGDINKRQSQMIWHGGAENWEDTTLFGRLKFIK